MATYTVATYTVAPRSNQAGFDVAVLGDDGARQTMLGFTSHAREAVHLIADPADSPSKVEAAVMPVETRRLHSSANGDRWYFARDTEAGHVFIKHEPNVSSGGRTSNIEIGEFLVRGGSGPEHQELLRLIGTLVEDPS